MEEKIVYFEEMGKGNTDVTLDLVKERAQTKGITTVVISSTTGFTAEKALQTFQDTDTSLVFVGIARARFSAKILKEIEKQGHKVLFTNDVDIDLPDLANVVFRRFSEGMRVAVLIMTVAVDQEAIPTDKPVIAVAGTGTYRFEERGGGADTAIIIDPCTYEFFFEPKYSKQERRLIREIICKPL